MGFTMSLIKIINDSNQVMLDDNYRYLMKTATVNLSNGAQNPRSVNQFNSSYGKMFYMTTMQYSVIDSWMLVSGSPFIKYGDYRRYMAYIFLGGKQKIYGIRFKKSCTDFDVYIRITPTLVGNMLNNDKESQYIMVEIATNDIDSDITTRNAYQDYYDIVEIANDPALIPECKYGVEIYAADGSPLWNSCCNIVNVVNSYAGIAGELVLSNIQLNHIIIPNCSYRRTDIAIIDKHTELRPREYRDFFMFKGEQLINTVINFEGYHGVRKYGKYKAGIWDPREFGNDENRKINGIIVSANF